MNSQALFVLYNKDDWNTPLPLQGSPETRLSFEEFYTYAATQGWDVYRAHIDWYDTKTGLFAKAWTFCDGKWRRVERPPKPMAIFDKIAGKYDYPLFEKKLEMFVRFPFVNSPTFRSLLDNKFHQYFLFSDWMPATFLAENKIQFKDAVEKITSPKVVVKLLYGSGGKEVTIEEKQVLLEKSFPFPVIAQEFIPTAGVPGFSQKEEVADLRLVFINHELIYALSRIAKKGSLFTNFHQGAMATIVPLDKIPPACLQVVASIQKKLQQFTRVHYSLDFMFTHTGEPLFIEMNTTPGFDLLRLVAPKEIREKHSQKLLDLFSVNL